MAKSMEGTNPVQDDGFELGVEGVGYTVIQYVLWFMAILISGGIALWAYTTGKEATGMDSDGRATLTVE